MHGALLYYITDRAAFPGHESARRRALLAKISEAARAGVDYIQLRERDLRARDLESLARAALSAIRGAQPEVVDVDVRAENLKPRTAFLINSRVDVALAVAADGVHLPARSISPADARRIWDQSTLRAGATTPGAIISVSCHDPAEVGQAEHWSANFTLFAPVFEKKDRPAVRPAGLNALRRACGHRIPVLALGGITLENAADCVAAGAAGIAAIRLFQDHDIVEVVRRLRG